MDFDAPNFEHSKFLKTYSNTIRTSAKSFETCESVTDLPENATASTKSESPARIVEELTTKDAVSFLLSGTLSSKVCRYCLNVTDDLYELEKVMDIANKGGIYSVTLKEIIATFYPAKVNDDPNLPNKICDTCTDRAVKTYLFTQQCDQVERAITNCFEDIYTKFNNLDPTDGPIKKRGRKKIYYNHNIIDAEHATVTEYADPVMHLINAGSESLTNEPALHPLECAKCCQVLPSIESLANHMKTHPKNMWFNCRLCGQSFAKRYLWTRHQRKHLLNRTPTVVKNKIKKDDEKFECKQCGQVNETYYAHLQHIEKHKFKIVMEHLIDRKMDNLCSICLDKGNLEPLERMVSFHGGPPDLMGDRTMQSILASILPEMNILSNYTGTKICEKCVNSAINSYTFMSHIYFVRDRLNTCVSVMLDTLNKIDDPTSNLCIEIAQNTIMPMKDPTDDIIYYDYGEIDESKLPFDVLENEFRAKYEEEIESVINVKSEVKTELPEMVEITNIREQSNKTKAKQNKLINGYQINICSEFLTFKTKPQSRKIRKKISCPICNKHFLSDYFVKRHLLKHVYKNIKCNPCGTKFANVFSLNEHTKYAHVRFQSDYRTCRTCGRGFTKTDKLKSHEKQHVNKICPLCDKVFKTQGYFDIHFKRHVSKLKMLKKKLAQSCSFCEKECSNDNELSVHVNKVHLQIKPYGCDMCEKQFYTEYNLKYHKKIHSKFSKEICMFCSKVLKSRRQLVVHIRKHIGATPHICQMCSQSFYSQAKLKKHMNVTHGGSFMCKICRHVSVSKSELKVHVCKAHSFFS